MRPPLLLKVSRPGLWFQTLWLYLLPTSQSYDVLTTPVFWLGAIYCTFPLNLLVYGWNDIVDTATDAINPRKDSYFFGARISGENWQTLSLWIALIQTSFVISFFLISGWRMLLILLAMIAATGLYNLPRYGLRGRPPLELFNQLGYLLILPLSTHLNHTAPLPWTSIFYLVLFCTHSHLMGEVMDIIPDRKSGRRTCATILGIAKTKALITALVAAESLFVWSVFDDSYLAGFLGMGVIWLLLDQFVLFPQHQYTRTEYYLFGWAINATGFGSMLWVWHQGTFLSS